MRILALGDSYTIGEGVPAEERWPNQLVRMLRAHAVDAAEPQIIARTAWTTDELSDAIEEERPTGPFDLVTLLVGVNDQYRSRPVREFEAGFRNLLRRAKGFAGRRAARTFALSIPDWSATPFAEGRDRARIAAEIDAYNAAAQALAAAAAIPWVDVTTSSRDVSDDPRLVSADGLHPSGELYRRWAELLLPQVLVLWKKRRTNRAPPPERG